MRPKFYFKFERQQVEHLQMDILLEAFNPQTLALPALRDLCGSVQIDFSGYTGCRQHPVLIPEVRRFLRTLARRWGPDSASFFSELNTPFLLLYYTCQLDHLWVLERDANDDFVLFHRREEAETLRRTSLAGLTALGKRAGIPTGVIRRRQKRINMLLSTALCFELAP